MPPTEDPRVSPPSPLAFPRQFWWSVPTIKSWPGLSSNFAGVVAERDYALIAERSATRGIERLKGLRDQGNDLAHHICRLAAA